jgi:hypothetical protein
LRARRPDTQKTWVGRNLILCRTGTENWKPVTLRGINGLSLAYPYKADEVGDETVFVPWASVSWMRPPIPRDLEASKA